jgi:hypothetical protein
MAGEPTGTGTGNDVDVDIRIRVDRELPWWRPLVNAVAAVPHLLVTGALTAASVGVAVVIGVAVAVTGRVPASLVRFQVMTLRERVRCYSYWFVLRESHPPFALALLLDDPGDDPATAVSIASPPEHLGRGALVIHWLRIVPHLVVLLPIGVVMDVCYPVWIVLAAVNRGWPESFARLLVAVERWVAHLALYALLATDTPPTFGLVANGYVPAGRPQPAVPRQ